MPTTTGACEMIPKRQATYKAQSKHKQWLKWPALRAVVCVVNLLFDLESVVYAVSSHFNFLHAPELPLPV